ncbi:unnamed protein product, partial [Musa acuminata var. zebrina]
LGRRCQFSRQRDRERAGPTALRLLLPLLVVSAICADEGGVHSIINGEDLCFWRHDRGIIPFFRSPSEDYHRRSWFLFLLWKRCLLLEIPFAFGCPSVMTIAFQACFLSVSYNS